MEWAAVIDFNHYAFTIISIGHTNITVQWQATMSSSHCIHVKGFTACSFTAVELATIPRGCTCLTELAYSIDRKSTRLNSSHVKISYAVFCLKKKTTNNTKK